MVKGPDLYKRVKNLKGAIERVADQGLHRVTLDEYKERIGICGECPGKHYNRGFCNHNNCGCFVAIKAWLKTEDCPAKYWPKGV